VAGRNIPSKEIKAILPSASLWKTLGQGRVPTQPPNQSDVKPWKQVVDEVREHSGSTSVYGFVFRRAEQRTSLDAMARHLIMMMMCVWFFSFPVRTVEVVVVIVVVEVVVVAIVVVVLVAIVVVVAVVV
ncbi:hypothetical protein ElyMa_003914600, partial [Elysia marginata]